MQNQNPEDSEEKTAIAVLDFLPKLPPLPPMFPAHTILWCLCLGTLATICFAQSNWIGGSVDVALIALMLGFSWKRYRTMKELYRHHHNLLAIRKILSTPTVVEEGNSMILTFLRPSDRLMDEMNKIALEVLTKKSPKK
jgi:hypothetical protein